jgi:peptidoglycan hydrolase-like protein with peptidoglycan-binding domain
MRNASTQVNNAALMQQKLRNAAKPTAIKTGTTKPAIAASVYPLKIGSRGKEVQQLQQKLGIKADGIFGKMTEASLVAQFAMKQIPNQALFVTIMLTKPKSKVPIKPKPKTIPKTKSKKVQAAKRKVKK